MPFRERVKQALRRTSTNNSAENSGHSTPKMPTEKEIEKWNQKNLPPSKFRRPVDPKHKQRLEAFSFGTHDRRNSNTSQFSPMGSRDASRRNSAATGGRKSLQKNQRGDSMGGVGKVDENAEDDTDTHNVGLSRPDSKGSDKSQPAADSTSTPPDPDSSMNPAIKLNSDQPFTQAQLDLALSKSRSKSNRLVV